jgi:cell division protein FtsB
MTNIKTKVDLGIWGKLSRLIVFLLLLASLLAVAIWYLPLIRQNERWAKQKLRLESQIKQEEQISRQLKASLKALQEDPRTVERLAREKLGYARSNETVIRFEAPVTNAAPRR